MQKTIPFIVVTLVVMAVGMSGCIETPTDAEKIIGTWGYEEEPQKFSFTFFSNGDFSNYDDNNGTITYLNGTYEIQDGKLILTVYFVPEEPFSYEYSYFFSDDYETLTLTDAGGISNNFLRQ